MESIQITTETTNEEPKMRAILYKQTALGRIQETEIIAISEGHAVELAFQMYGRLGLIGRYYLETETGQTFYISK